MKILVFIFLANVLINESLLEQIFFNIFEHFLNFTPHSFVSKKTWKTNLEIQITWKNLFKDLKLGELNQKQTHLFHWNQSFFYKMGYKS